MDTILTIKFTKLHVFPYSRRAGTVADTMPNQIDEVIKKDRVHQLLNLSKKLELDYMKKFMNQELIFLPEVWKDGFLVGHTGNYLTLKVKGEQTELNQDLKVFVQKIEYTYLICDRIKIDTLETVN